jgi:hypothetical protein
LLKRWTMGNGQWTISLCVPDSANLLFHIKRIVKAYVEHPDH